MSNCSSCSAPIPDGQSICSMCYGDPYHGNDGYYLEEIERAGREQRRMDEEEQEREREE